MHGCVRKFYVLKNNFYGANDNFVHTPIAQASQVNKCRVWAEMFWSCLLDAFAQFALILPEDVVIALTGEFSFAADITLVKGSHWEFFEDESLQSLSIYTPFLSTLFISIYAFHNEAGDEETWKSPGHFLGLSICNCRRDLFKYKTINFSKDIDYVPGIGQSVIPSVISINGNMN